MEKKDFLEQLDLNKDSQISKEDVKSLWEILSKENPKYNKEFVEKLEKDPKLKEVLFALEPSFLDVINSKDFIINPENKENIIILQFFAKYFRWENVEINGQFTPETEKLYLESSLQTKSLDQNTFSWNNELELFKTWIWMNDSITIQTVSREEFDKIKPNITEKNNLKWDWKDKPQGYNLKIPEDLKNTETPMFMKAVNKIAYWEELPKESAFKTYQSKLEANIKYLESIEDEASENPDTKAQYEKLMWKLEQIKNNYYEDEDWVDENIVENELWSINWKMSLEFAEIWNEQIKWQKDNPKVKMMLLEKMISKDLRNYMDLAVFERGTETLFNYLNTPTKKEHEYLLDEGKRKEALVTEIDSSLSEKLESMSDVKQKLKDSIWVEKYKEELKGLEWEERISKEKEVCKKLLEEINKYPRTNMDNSENSQPAKMLETQKMICVWKSIIAWWFLQELWIKFDTLNVWWHSALMVYLSDWKEYYFDSTNTTDLSEFENIQKVEWWTYEKWKTILQNKFAEWWKIDLWSNWALIDSDWMLHFSKADPEFWLMWQLYGNKSNEEDIPTKDSILLLQRAIEINPNGIDGYLNLANRYMGLWNYNEAIKLLEEWWKIDKDSSKLIENITILIQKINDPEKAISLSDHFIWLVWSNKDLITMLIVSINNLWDKGKILEYTEKYLNKYPGSEKLLKAYWEIASSYFKEWNKENAYMLAEKLLKYWEQPLALIILSKKEIEKWNYEKAYNLLNKASNISWTSGSEIIETIDILIKSIKNNDSKINELNKLKENLLIKTLEWIDPEINKEYFIDISIKLVQLGSWIWYQWLLINSYYEKNLGEMDKIYKDFLKLNNTDELKTRVSKQYNYFKKQLIK